MTKKWQSGCLRIELQDAPGTRPMGESRARFFIHAEADSGRQGEVLSEGELGIQLAHLLHACVVLSSGEGEEWFVPTPGHPLHLRRHGRQIEIARYPSFVSQPSNWLSEDGLYLVDFGMLLESLSAAVEWVLDEVSNDFAQDDTVQVLIVQWERAWQRFSRLVTFRRVSLAFV